MTWTPTRIAQLRFLWSLGQTGNEIALTMGLTRNQVIGKASRLGLSARPSPIKRKPPPTPGAFLMVDLTDANCRYPMGGPKEKAVHFCGQPTGGIARPYCSEHHQATRQPRALKKPPPTEWDGPQVRIFA